MSKEDFDKALDKGLGVKELICEVCSKPKKDAKSRKVTVDGRSWDLIICNQCKDDVESGRVMIRPLPKQ